MALIPRLPARARRVTQEPLQVAEPLLGAPLASFRRRAFALALDVLLFSLLAGALFLGLTLRSIQGEDPTLLPRLRAGLSGRLDPAATSGLTVDLLELVHRRAPTALPCELAAAVESGTVAGMVAAWNDQDLSLALGASRTSLERNGDRWLLRLGTDVTLGRNANFFSWGAFFVGWFTVLARLGRGRTPGKALLGLRVVRLDGRPLNWWNAFDRAGSYGASAATGMLGFLEALWDPNGQALHDRTCGTVVVRQGRGGNR